jgi:hypothetical protein
VANLDWRNVYREEKRRPGYVIENGKTIAKTHGGDTARRNVTFPQPQNDKRKAA